MKHTILIDLDGVLNEYNGTYNKDLIPPIKDGAYEFISKLSEDYIIKIFTSRNLLLVSKWIYDNNLNNYVQDVTNAKEPCYLIIDDRCVNFNGNFDELEKCIENFEVWYK